MRFNRRPVPIEVQNQAGNWCGGFLLLSFNADGTVTVRSSKTGAIKNLQQHHWRDPVEIEIMQRHGLTP
jgi:hypothetical protein